MERSVSIIGASTLTYVYSVEETSTSRRIDNVSNFPQRLRNDVVNNVGEQLDDMMSDVMYELEAINKFEGINALHLDETEKYRDKR